MIQAPNSSSNSVLVNWTNGNGSGRVVFIHTLNSFLAPSPGSLPTPNPSYSGSGQQCVYAGNSGNSVQITGLQAGTTYYLRAYEYCQPGFVFNTSTASNNPLPFTTPQAPYLTVSPDSLLGFNYMFGAGPSLAQTYQLSGGNLTSGNVSISASAAFEISTNGQTFNPTLSLPIQGGVVLGQPLTLYVRMKSGLAQGQYGWENQIHVGGGAPAVNLFCLGEVNSNTEIVENGEIPAFTFWPNPSTQNYFFAMLSNSPEGSYYVTIHDIQGRLLVEQKSGFSPAQAQTIELPHLNSGSYIIAISDLEGNLLGRQRFVKISK